MFLTGQRFRSQRLTEGETERLAKLEKTLHKRVVGQEEAVETVAKAVKRGRVGLKDPNVRLVHSYSLDQQVLVRQNFPRHLQKHLWQDENAMIRVDMSEYMEKTQCIQDDRFTSGICRI